MVLPGKQPGLLVAVIVPAFLSTVVVIARFMRKLKRRPSYISKTGALAAEVLLIASVISGWISGVFVIISLTYGFGRHQNDILAKPNGMQDLIHAAFWQTTGYPFNVGCYTLSVAGQVLHYRTWLFHNVNEHRILSYVMNVSGILQVIFGTLCVIFVFAKCSPVQGNWDMTVDAVCWDENIFLGINYTSSAITFVSYMIQGWIPIQMALSLGRRSITRNQWMALSTIAFWNIIAGVLALVKLSFLHLYVVQEDATWRRVILVEIGLAENGASGIVPSAAEMWAMVQQIANRSKSGTGDGYNGYGSRSRVEQPNRAQSNDSEIELTGDKTGLGQGITKTMAWETSTDAQQDAWLNVSEQDKQVFQTNFLPSDGGVSAMRTSLQR